MSIRQFNGTHPSIHPSAYVDKDAVVIGDVTLAEDVSIWPCVVIRGDVNDITIGARSNIQDGSVLHVTHESEEYGPGLPLIIGEDVTVGHKVVLHACTIGNRCLIGMGSVVLDNAIIEDEKIKIVHREGILIVEELQLPNKKRMHAQALLNGFTFENGAEVL